MSAVVILVSLKTVRFSCKDKSENTFIKYVMPRVQATRHYKVRIFFAIDNTLWGLVWVLYKISPLAVEQEAKIKGPIWLHLIYTT